jgi:hypothetical protein
MKRYFKNFDTFICFDEAEKLITTVTSHTSIDGKSMVYTKDDKSFDALYAGAVSRAESSGIGPNTSGWAEITEEIYNQAKQEVKLFFMNL